MTFDEALPLVKAGRHLTRTGWSGVKWIGICEGASFLAPSGVHARKIAPFIYMETTTQMPIPWIASQTDLLADDWFLIG